MDTKIYGIYDLNSFDEGQGFSDGIRLQKKASGVKVYILIGQFKEVHF